ncbi:MAG: class I SAM-dependent methyltransferase [Acidobacteriaceae bacterium]
MKPAPPPNFDPVARIYRFAEYLSLGPLLQRTRTHFIPQLPPAHQALILGDGDGRALATLLATQPHLQALAVDTSAAMLHQLRQRNRPYANRLQTLQASALDLFPNATPTIGPPGPQAPVTNSPTQVASPPRISSEAVPSPPKTGYPEALASGLISPQESKGVLTPDLITTHFFLDCLTQPQLDALAQNLAAHTAPGALWLLSDFAIPATPILKPFAAAYIRFLYFAFRILTNLRVTHLPNPQASLTSANFHRVARHELLHGLLYTEIWQRG